MLGLKLNHVCKRGYWTLGNDFAIFIFSTFNLNHFAVSTKLKHFTELGFYLFHALHTHVYSIYLMDCGKMFTPLMCDLPINIHTKLNNCSTKEITAYPYMHDITMMQQYHLWCHNGTHTGVSLATCGYLYFDNNHHENREQIGTSIVIYSVWKNNSFTYNTLPPIWSSLKHEYQQRQQPPQRR